MFQNKLYVFAARLNVVKNARGLQLLFQKLNRLKYKTKQLEQNYQKTKNYSCVVPVHLFLVANYLQPSQIISLDTPLESFSHFNSLVWTWTKKVQLILLHCWMHVQNQLHVFSSPNSPLLQLWLNFVPRLTFIQNNNYILMIRQNMF